MKGRPLKVQIMVSLEVETVQRIDKALEDVLEKARTAYPKQKLTRSQMIESLVRNGLHALGMGIPEDEHAPSALSEADDAQ